MIFVYENKIYLTFRETKNYILAFGGGTGYDYFVKFYASDKYFVDLEHAQKHLRYMKVSDIDWNILNPQYGAFHKRNVPAYVALTKMKMYDDFCEYLVELSRSTNKEDILDIKFLMKINLGSLFSDRLMRLLIDNQPGIIADMALDKNEIPKLRIKASMFIRMDNWESFKLNIVKMGIVKTFKMLAFKLRSTV